MVGIDGRYDLVDGGRVTQPRYAFWFAGGAGWSVEGHGVDPDIDVPIAPHDWAAGRDPQLETAIATVLASLEQQAPGAATEPQRSAVPGPADAAAAP